jgi:hypothetical protein
MLDEISKNKFKAKDFDEAPNMTSIEKKISFLNRYFVYKKVRSVNAENITLELGEYNAATEQKNRIDTARAQEIAEKEVKAEAEEKKGSKIKVRKLSKKLQLVPATEAVDEPKPVVTKQAKEKKPVAKKPAPLMIIESDSDSD